MHQNKQSTTIKVCSLGMCLLAVFCVLFVLASAGPVDTIIHQEAETPQFYALFFLLPIGSLINNIGTEFHPEDGQDKHTTFGSMAAFAKALAAAQDKEQIKKVLFTGISEMHNPQFVDLYLYDSEEHGYFCENDHKQNNLLPNFIALDSDLPKKIIASPGILSPADETYEFQTLEEAHLEAAESNKHLLIPINNKNKLMGWLLLGPPKDSPVYTLATIKDVEHLAYIFAIAYEKADLFHTYQTEFTYNEIQSRIVNTANTQEDFDQILANIFSHLQEIIAIREFSLILSEPETNVYQRLFSIQNNQLTITTSRPQALKAEYIEKDTITTGEIKQVEDKGSWLIIPMVSKGAIVGALSLGNAQKNDVFKSININFIHFFAGAVANAAKIFHLLQVNRRQNQQLDIFNKISEQLTSIINLEALLNKILDAAMNILNCSSGVLLMLDKDQDALVFEVTAGPVGTNLQGARLPSNAGIAGQAFTTRKPILINHVNQATLWFSKGHPQALAKIANILALPIIAHGQVIGVLELINKGDNQPFNENDLQILEGFTNQATIALHNAARYSESDQALEARVEELYVMQEIDRDMNASQDINRALQRMLSASLKHTAAQYGTIGLVDQNTKTYENIWQIRPAEDAPLMFDDIDLQGKTWFSNENFKLKLLQSPELSSSFKISDEHQWHYLIYYELKDNQALLLVLHAESAEQLTRQDRVF